VPGGPLFSHSKRVKLEEFFLANGNPTSKDISTMARVLKVSKSSIEEWYTVRY
jgi:Homeodomain